jgi:hypothetical protein
MSGVGPAAEALLFQQKDPKPAPPRPALLDWADAEKRARQLARLRQGPPPDKNIHPWGRTAGVGQEKGGKFSRKWS